MNKLTTAKRAAVIRGLTEGNSIRSVVRMTGASKGTVLRLLEEVGTFCAVYHDVTVRNLPCRTVELDEQWSFSSSKEKNATKPGQGDLWVYVGLCADSKMAFSYLVGRRNHENTFAFTHDVASRLRHRVQVTTDGLAWYLAAIEAAFGWNGCDFAQLVKTYGAQPDMPGTARKYSPMECTGAVKTPIFGDPMMHRVSTSYVERFNLSTRMGNRRMTRLTNGFSKKAENHAHAMALHMFSYNFMKQHGTLTSAAKGKKTSPAMVCGLTDHVWTVEEMLEKMDGLIGAEKL
jgi:IS1 family transposase